MMLFPTIFPIMSNGFYGSFERWQWDRKVVEGRCSSGIYTDMWETMGNAWVGRCGGGGSLLLGIQGCEGGIHLLLGLQWMPLGDGATGVCQHVGPVFQPGPRGLASHPDLPNGIILANLVIIQDCDHSLDFLENREKPLQSSNCHEDDISIHLTIHFYFPTKALCLVVS